MRPDQVWRFIAADPALYKQYRELTTEQRDAYDKFVEESYKTDAIRGLNLPISWRPQISLVDWLRAWHEAQLYVHVLCKNDFPAEAYEDERQAKDQAVVRNRVAKINAQKSNGLIDHWHVQSVRLEARRG